MNPARAALRIGEIGSETCAEGGAPSGEITELVNRDLDVEDNPFQAKDVAEWLRNTEDTALTLYWSRARPRK